jgi:hypothetical protein
MKHAGQVRVHKNIPARPPSQTSRSNELFNCQAMLVGINRRVYSPLRAPLAVVTPLSCNIGLTEHDPNQSVRTSFL